MSATAATPHDGKSTDEPVNEPVGNATTNDLCFLGQIYRKQAAEIAYNLLASKKSRSGGCTDDSRITMPGWGRTQNDPASTTERNHDVMSSRLSSKQDNEIHSIGMDTFPERLKENNHSSPHEVEDNTPLRDCGMLKSTSHGCETDGTYSDYDSEDGSSESDNGDSDEEFRNRLLNLEKQVNQLKRERLEFGEFISKSGHQSDDVTRVECANALITGESECKKQKNDYHCPATVAVHERTCDTTIAR